MRNKEKTEWIALILGWFAILAQFVLIIQNRQSDIPETILRFFSFFTILTNFLLALFFTAQIVGQPKFPLKWFFKGGTITALTSFILIVGLVYQIALRPLWAPTGLQWLVDELLHTLIPLLMLAYWFFQVRARDVKASSVFKWLIYPILYAVFILIRGHFSGFYPYPFLNVREIGYLKTMLNMGGVASMTLVIMAALVLLGKRKTKELRTEN
ncbi:Pr6Pr family membrane protein [Algoriphagus confluentis]|uniref:Pr6Pr family membrane protein n=1 Tax=Algoriphagus confluentis TaxID=1697556 RepID=A0ABQ6PSJ2_9BACT|nr:Pr6Pr family membrane protein [Algoriphagus confluentis]